MKGNSTSFDYSDGDSRVCPPPVQDRLGPTHGALVGVAQEPEPPQAIVRTDGTAANPQAVMEPPSRQSPEESGSQRVSPGQ